MIRLGIICPSEIAFRRFLPALQKVKGIEFCGIGIANAEEWYGEGIRFSEEENRERIEREKTRAQEFINTMSRGKLYESYTELVSAKDVDAVYLPLPPALHFKWARKALEKGKHVFVEKPSTTSLADTRELVSMAKERKLALHENYMFVYHRQLEELNEIVRKGTIGDVRLYRITFGFPRRARNDFRYNKVLGGGALIDAGGYTLKYAAYLLGDTARLSTAQLNYEEGFDVDMYGSATMINDQGVTAQLAFGMDNDYKCEIEVWGSIGTLTSGRILTAPEGLVPEYTIKKNQSYETFCFSSDDAFMKSIEVFKSCVENDGEREEEYQKMLHQSALLEQFKTLVG